MELENEFENISEENLLSNEPEINLNELKDKKMEVHHHAHHHGQKNWKTYIWEFFMLFLAVFCGFYAELQLEHLIESHKEKQYIQSMVEDLKMDTTKINFGISDNLQIINGIDSLLNQLYQSNYSDTSIANIYYLDQQYTTSAYLITFTQGTLAQLKNSGGLRLIQSLIASDSIINYDEQGKFIESQGDYYDKGLLIPLRQLSYKIFDSKVYSDCDTPCTLLKLRNLKPKIVFLDDNPKLLREYANRLKSMNNILKYYISLLEEHKQRAERLMHILQKEYHLH